MSLVNYDYGSSDDDDDDDVGNIDEKEVLNQKSDADINSTTKKEPKIGIPNSSTSSDQSNFNSSFSMVKYKKSDGKVQISAFNDNTKELLLAQPNLESDDDELDEEEEQRRKRRKRSSKGSCLLSMLPKPKNKSKTSTTSMIPASVKNRKSEQSSKGLS
ncbi:N-acetyltransferase 9-like protein [Sarcoptes scabiei]|nr:N-acetyltransferase 9-like protein [Sarcoptes scabiei]